MPPMTCRPIDRIRRNHALEHATLHVLSTAQPGKSLAGWSDVNGFWLLGDVGIEDVGNAVQVALVRLRAGETQLAVHPHCGTNYAVSGLLAGMAGWLGMLGAGRKLSDQLERLPLVVLLTTVVFIFSRPLGPLLQQRLTTNGRVGNLQVTQITAQVSNPRNRLHRIRTIN